VKLFQRFKSWRAVKSQDAVVTSLPAKAKSEPAITIATGLTRLTAMEGVRKACYIRGSKAMVEGDIRDATDGFLRVARIAAKAGQRVSRRMETGDFKSGTIDGDFGHICVCSSAGVMAAAQCDAGSSVDEVLRGLQTLVDMPIRRQAKS
jgi:predicted regulator of Ras-like GTPase activity (Roadblock/LC7/MglB family)